MIRKVYIYIYDNMKSIQNISYYDNGKYFLRDELDKNIVLDINKSVLGYAMSKDSSEYVLGVAVEVIDSIVLNLSNTIHIEKDNIVATNFNIYPAIDVNELRFYKVTSIQGMPNQISNSTVGLLEVMGLRIVIK